MRSLSVKLTLAFMITSLLSVILVSLLARWATFNAYDQIQRDEIVQDYAERFSDYYAQHGSWTGSVQTIAPPTAPGQPPRNPPPIMVVDANGRSIMGPPPYMPGAFVPDNIIARGIPIEVNGQQVGTILNVNDVPRQPDQRQIQFEQQVNNATIGAAIGGTFLGLIISILFARTLTQPLRELTAATRLVAAGKLEQQVAVRSQDELGQLAKSFNQMSADLHHATQVRKQMTADIAHDLRSPLTVINGHLEGLRDGVLRSTPERFDVMYNEVQQLLRLVDDLRTISLAEAGELPLYRRATPPQELLERAVVAFRPQAEQQKVMIQIEASTALPDVNVDPQRFAQVLGNLIGNALRYTSEGGHIQLMAEQMMDRVLLTIADTGSGIPSDVLPYIFDRFYRADQSRTKEDGHSGLGLAIARSIIEAHGGQIKVDSTLGKGTTFQIMLPC